MLAQLCGPKAMNETEMGAALFTKNSEGRTLTLSVHPAVNEYRAQSGGRGEVLQSQFRGAG